MELGGGLEGVVHGDEEGRLSDGLEDAALRLGVLRRLPLLHDRRLLQHLHRVQLTAVRAAPLPRQEHLPVRCNRGGQTWILPGNTSDRH